MKLTSFLAGAGACTMVYYLWQFGCWILESRRLRKLAARDLCRRKIPMP